MTEVQTVTLADFLLAMLADDEVWAEARMEPRPGNMVGDTSVAIRLRKEIEAKRQIVSLHGNSHGDCSQCFQYASYMGDVEFEQYPCPTLRALALVYANHPDYREEWKP